MAHVAEQPTLPAIQRALALERHMQAAGLTSPCQLVLEPSADYAKLRRHLNPKYRFEPLRDYEPRAL